MILAPQQGIRPTIPALESQVLITGPGKSLGCHFSNPEWSRTGLTGRTLETGAELDGASL